MADEKKEPWLNVLALATVILAVAATLSTFKGGGFSTRSVLQQNQASDQWAFYQAKSIKGSLYEMEGERLSRELKALDNAKAPAILAEAVRTSIEDVRRKVAKYEKEKAEIRQAAQALETSRDDAQRHGRPFGLAVIFLQIAILLNSISALLKKQPVFWGGLALGLVGLAYFFNGFFLFW
jgi:hypothetical protein